jgi:hypothetical protein
MNDINDIFQLLNSIRVRSKPKSMNIFNKTLCFTELFEKLKKTEQTEIIEVFTDIEAGKLLTLSVSLAEVAMLTGNVKWINGAIILQIIEDFRIDYRNNVRHLVLIDRSAIYINTNLAEVVKKNIHMASSRASFQLTNFIERSKSLNKISDYGKKIDIIDNKPMFTNI